MHKLKKLKTKSCVRLIHSLLFIFSLMRDSLQTGLKVHLNTKNKRNVLVLKFRLTWAFMYIYIIPKRNNYSSNSNKKIVNISAILWWYGHFFQALSYKTFQVRKDWRYQSGNQKLWFEKGQTIQRKKDKQWSTKHLPTDRKLKINQHDPITVLKLYQKNVETETKLILETDHLTSRGGYGFFF